MSQTTSNDLPTQLPDDMLPPVQPPSARFILQLFVYPLAIVSGIVAIGLLVNWAVRAAAGDPREYVAALKRNNGYRWQAAANLADTLNRADSSELPVHEEYLYDRTLAREVALVLEDELASGAHEEEDVTLRMYLCAALGKFKVDEPVIVLLEAATTRKSEKDLPVRKYALMALAELAADLPPERLRDDPHAMQVLLRAAQDSEYQIQEAAAFTLGVVGGERAIEQLVKLLAPTTHPNPRYNAATGLARQGDERAIPVLIEMMNPETVVGLEEEEKESRDIKLASIVKNGLGATRRLIEKNPRANRSQLTDAVERLKEADLDALFRKQTKYPLSSETKDVLHYEIDLTQKALNGSS